MDYRDNVQFHCTRLGIENPLQEKDLQVEKVIFFKQGVSTTIKATPTNRAGRFFFQITVNRPEFTSTSLIEHDALTALRAQAARFFAENWVDAEQVGRPMLVAFKGADSIIIHWR